MNDTPRSLRSVDLLIKEIRERIPLDAGVFVIALDGRSGVGKSTLASVVAPVLRATVVPTDDFFAAHITDAGWDARTPEQRAADVVDWPRLRRDAIEPLRAGLPARWFGFDFGAGVGADGTYSMQKTATERAPSRIVILDGAYSSRPELSDLIDLAVLIEVPSALRQRRLAAREDAAFLSTWHARWDAAEDHYFNDVRPPGSFDLVFDGSLEKAG